MQVTKDPIGTKGARLTMEVSIPGRYLVYAPDGDGVGVSRKLPDKERERLRKLASGLKLEQGGLIIRTAAHGARKSDMEREVQYLLQAGRGASEQGGGVARADDGVPGGGPADPRRAGRLLARVRPGGDRRREAASPHDELLHAYRARAAGTGGAVQGRRPAVREVGRRRGVPRDALAAGRPAARRLPDDRPRRGADGDRRQHRQLHGPRPGLARGHDHEDEPAGGRGGRAAAAPARHRRDHRDRLHRHGVHAQPRQGARRPEERARRRPHAHPRGRDLSARAGRDDSPERVGGRARDHEQDLPDLRRRGCRALGGDDRDRRRAAAAQAREDSRARRRSWCRCTRAWRRS